MLGQRSTHIYILPNILPEILFQFIFTQKVWEDIFPLPLQLIGITNLLNLWHNYNQKTFYSCVYLYICDYSCILICELILYSHSFVNCLFISIVCWGIYSFLIDLYHSLWVIVHNFKFWSVYIYIANVQWIKHILTFRYIIILFFLFLF